MTACSQLQRLPSQPHLERGLERYGTSRIVAQHQPERKPISWADAIVEHTSAALGEGDGAALGAIREGEQPHRIELSEAPARPVERWARRLVAPSGEPQQPPHLFHGQLRVPL